jgi:hypothetical protein
MAQPIYCDFDGCTADDGQPTPAVWLVSNLDDGESLAWCSEHYYDLMRATVTVAAADPEPEPEPADSDEPSPEDRAASLAAIDRLAALGASVPAAEAAGVSEPTPEPEQAAAAAQARPGGPTVVARGTSRGRRRHEAKKRAAAQAAEEDKP